MRKWHVLFAVSIPIVVVSWYSFRPELLFIDRVVNESLPSTIAGSAQSNAVKQAGFVEIAPLHGNEGNQNYLLPNGLDLAKYRSVTIWCRRFSVNFATAALRLAKETDSVRPVSDRIIAQK